MNIFKKKNNRHKSKNLRSYKEYQKDTYKYRVDEILDNIFFNDKKYLELKKESDLLYEKLNSMLNEDGQKCLRQYSDIETDKQEYEEYRLAEQIYEELER